MPSFPTPRQSAIPCLLALALVTFSNAHGAPVGAGSYRDGLPASNPADPNWRPPSQVTSWGPGGVPVYGPAQPKFKPGVAAVSNKWWSGLGWIYWGAQPSGPSSVPNFALPGAFQARANGAGIWQADGASVMRQNGGATDWTTGTPIDGMVFLNNGYPNSQYFHFYDQDLVAGLEGLNSGDPLVAGYSDWAVTAEWSSGGDAMQLTSASGSPYFFFKRTAGNAGARVEVTGGLNVFHTAGNVVGLTVNKAIENWRPGSTHHYLLVAPSGVNWTQSGNVFNAALGAKGYFTVVALPNANAATVAEYAALAHNHITNTRLTWSYNEAAATLVSTYSFSTLNPDTGATNGPTLSAVFPHTYKANLNNPVNTAYTYRSPRGELRVVRGLSYSSRMRFNGLLPTLPVAQSDVARLDAYVNDVANNPGKLWPTPPEASLDDAYWFGRAVGRAASLLAIAAQTGNTAARDSLLAAIKPRLQDWLTYTAGENNRHFAYDPTWRTLCPMHDVHYACRDLSDHHFINGYFIRAAALVALHDPNGSTWAAQWGPMIEKLIKDPMNWDRNDTQFAFMRHYSPIEGHTWASGIAFGNGLNEESSSESMNFATGVTLWGMVTGNKTIRNLGILQYTHQSRAIEEYWLDVDQNTHATDFKPPHAGIIWGNGSQYGTWWTAEPRAILGINILPITSGSVYFGRRADQIPRQLAAMQSYQTLYQSLPAPTPPGIKPLMGPQEWSDLFWSLQAHADPAGALAAFNANPAAPTEFGQTKADVYHYIAALNQFGKLDTTVTANIPSYNVFNKGGVKTYVAFNPAGAPACVSFSDGRTMSVEARKLTVNGAPCAATGDTQAPSVPTGLVLTDRSTSSVSLAWAAATDNVGVTGYQVLRNGSVVGTPSGTAFVDTGLTAATSYSYTLKARDAAGNVSAASAALVASTSSGTVSGRGVLQAEAFTSADPRITRVLAGTAVGTTLDGSWIKLSAVDFGSTSPVDFLMRVASGLAGSGAITLYRDSISPANQIAVLGMGNTGGWSNFQTVAMNLSAPVTGVHDLYITFNTPYVDANGLVNVDWLQFR